MDQLPPLDVFADLDVRVDGEDVRVTAEGDVMVVRVPSARAGARLLRSGPFAGQRGQRLEQANQALRLAGLTLEVRVEGDTVARLGEQAQPGSLARLLRLGETEVRTAPLLRQVPRPPPFAWGAAAAVTGLALLFWWRRRR